MKKKIIYLIFFLILLSCFGGCLSNSYSNSKTTPNPNTQKITVPPFESQPVTEDTVKIALRNMNVSKFLVVASFDDPQNAFSLKLMEVRVEDDKSSIESNQKIVRIRYLNDLVWDSRHFMQLSSMTDLAVIYNLFKNPSVNKLIIETDTKFTDQYGNEYQDVGLTITFNKETAKKINYDNFIDSVQIDYRKLLNIAESYKINPSILRALSQEK